MNLLTKEVRVEVQKDRATYKEKTEDKGTSPKKKKT